MELKRKKKIVIDIVDLLELNDPSICNDNLKVIN